MYKEGALCLTFSGDCSSLSRLSSPGEKEVEKAQGRKNETQASNCQICNNVKFLHYYPGYSGNHFTRLRRYLGLKSEIFIKPLTSTFAKTIALSLNLPCVKMATGTQTWRDSPQAPHPTMDQKWHSQTSSKAPFPGDQGGPGPSLLPTVPLGSSSSSYCCWSHQHTAIAAANTNSCVTGLPVTLCDHGLFMVWCFPWSSLASPAPALEFAIWMQQELGTIILLPHWGLAADCSFHVLFNTRKNTFPPPCWRETKEQDKNSSKFWGVFLVLFLEDKGWHAATGFSPKFCFMKWMF